MEKSKSEAGGWGVQGQKDGSELLRFSGLESVVTQRSPVCVRAGSRPGTNLRARRPVIKNAERVRSARKRKRERRVPLLEK